MTVAEKSLSLFSCANMDLRDLYYFNTYPLRSAQPVNNLNFSLFNVMRTSKDDPDLIVLKLVNLKQAFFLFIFKLRCLGLTFYFNTKHLT